MFLKKVRHPGGARAWRWCEGAALHDGAMVPWCQVRAQVPHTGPQRGLRLELGKVLLLFDGAILFDPRGARRVALEVGSLA
jgi:hypothetical protein